jgi:glycosyltransferase involved in cell wall biosynthesis
MTGKLWVVMPAYNEEACLRHVAEEWLHILKQSYPDFIFLALNDGSKDSTFAILDSIAGKEEQFRVIDKLNSGHGQTCLEGYRIALQEAAEWILQIDSDGQCDPVYFERFVNKASEEKIIYGYRKSRDDGWRRLWISRLVTLAAFVATGAWVRDCNVPYRLMHRTTLEKVVGLVPSDFHLVNILVAVLQEKCFGISWIPIHFRNRMSGTASVKTYSFVKHGIKLFTQLRTATRANRDV